MIRRAVASGPDLAVGLYIYPDVWRTHRAWQCGSVGLEASLVRVAAHLLSREHALTTLFFGAATGAETRGGRTQRQRRLSRRRSAP